MFEQRIASVLNRALADSQRAQSLCASLGGRSLRVEAIGSPWALVVHSDGRALAVKLVDRAAPVESNADAAVTGSPLTLLALAGNQRRAILQRGDATITGDGQIAEQFSELAELLRPDVEHELGSLIGPVPAHLLVGGVQRLRRWGRATLDATLNNGAEYLAHERRDLVPTPEAEHLLRNIEQLREQLDRLDATVGALEQRLPAAQATAEARR